MRVKWPAQEQKTSEPDKASCTNLYGKPSGPVVRNLVKVNPGLNVN